MNERLQFGRVSTIAWTVAIKARNNDSVVDVRLHASRLESSKAIGGSYDRYFLLLCLFTMFSHSIRR